MKRSARKYNRDRRGRFASGAGAKGKPKASNKPTADFHVRPGAMGSKRVKALKAQGYTVAAIPHASRTRTVGVGGKAKATGTGSRRHGGSFRLPKVTGKVTAMAGRATRAITEESLKRE